MMYAGLANPFLITEATMERFFCKVIRKEIGLSLISLLVTVVIIGVLAAILIPTISKYIGGGSETGNPSIATGATAAAEAEKVIVANGVQAAMTDAKVSSIGGGGPFTLDKNNDLDVETGGKTGTYLVGKYFAGGIGTLRGTYIITNTGGVNQASNVPSNATSNTQSSTPKLDLPIGLPTFTVSQPPDLNPGKLIPTAIPTDPGLPFP
jgi:hypothetical protein